MTSKWNPDLGEIYFWNPFRWNRINYVCGSISCRIILKIPFLTSKVSNFIFNHSKWRLISMRICKFSSNFMRLTIPYDPEAFSERLALSKSMNLRIRYLYTFIVELFSKIFNSKLKMCKNLNLNIIKNCNTT